MTIGKRLATLELIYRRPPEGCAGTGSHCPRFETVRVGGSAQPALAPVDGTCRRCGRPTFTRTYLLVADGDELAEQPA